MKQELLQSRRQVIKTFVVLSASSLLPGGRWTARVLAQMGPTSFETGGVLKLKVSDYPALAQVGGSVRIGTSRLLTTQNCSIPEGLFYPVLINRAANNQFHALNAACTHEGCAVAIYNSTQGYARCPKHGSRYSIDGTATLGPDNGPAGSPLQSYIVQFDGVDTLLVGIDEMNFDLTSTSVQEGGVDRMSLTFLAFEFIQYEVQARATVAANWTTVPFSLTPTGPLDQTVLTGNSDYNTVYVDRSAGAGFFAVVMRTRTV